MDWLDWLVIILLIILGLIFLIFIILLITAIVVYNRIKNEIKTTLTNLVQRECTGDIDKHPVFVPMDPNIYSKPNAAAVLRSCAALTYSDGCGRDVIIPGPDFILLARYDGYDTIANIMRPFAALFYSPSLKILFVCFSATIQISEWEDNFLLQQVQPVFLNNNQSDMLVHTGFYNIYTGSIGNATSLKNNIINGINKYLHTGDTILIGGHSLGAAIATICFFDVCNLHPNTVLYTTGCPRVGNTPFAEFLSKQVLNYRLFNTEDEIITLPPPFLFGWAYTQSSSQLQFSLSLDNYSSNHNNCYIIWLESGATN